MAHKIGWRDVDRAFERYVLLTGDGDAALWRDEDEAGTMSWGARMHGADGELRVLHLGGNERACKILLALGDAWQEGRRVLLEELGIEPRQEEPTLAGEAPG